MTKEELIQVIQEYVANAPLKEKRRIFRNIKTFKLRKLTK